VQVNRNIRLSIKYHLAGLLTTYGYTNVYGEAEMRQVTNGTLTPTGNYVFLVDSFISPTQTTLPFVVMEITSIRRIPYELGNDGAGREITTFVHVFGRSRAERDDIASYFQDNIGRSIPYNDYTSGSAVAQTYPIQRTGEGIDVSYAPPVTDEQLQEHSLANWNILNFEARTIT
jgi:hypothetical protein